MIKITKTKTENNSPETFLFITHFFPRLNALYKSTIFILEQLVTLEDYGDELISGLYQHRGARVTGGFDFGIPRAQYFHN
jgi:hypothetical protein